MAPYRSLVGALMGALLATASGPAMAQTEIQWWHAMTGANNDVIVKLATDFNASQKDYKVVPTYKGSYADTMNAGIAAFRVGRAPHIMQVFEVGTATMMSAGGAIKRHPAQVTAQIIRQILRVGIPVVSITPQCPVGNQFDVNLQRPNQNLWMGIVPGTCQRGGSGLRGNRCFFILQQHAQFSADGCAH